MLDELNDNLFKTYCHFIVCSSLSKLWAPNIVWEENALENIKTMNKFWYFFWFTKESSRKIYLLELAKFFDKDNQALSIYKILNFLKSNIKYFTYENYKHFSWDNYFCLENEYIPINNKNISHYETQIDSILDLVVKLRQYRDQFIAHNQIKPEEPSINIWEIELITNILIEVINDCSYHLFSSTYSHKYQEDEIFNEIKRIIDFLNKYDKYIIQEINE